MDSDGGWLSTRNKSKIQPKQKFLRRRTSLPKQPKPLSEFALTQSPPPVELFINTKQSQLTNFFKPKLKLAENHREVIKQLSDDDDDVKYLDVQELGTLEKAAKTAKRVICDQSYHPRNGKTEKCRLDSENENEVKSDGKTKLSKVTGLMSQKDDDVEYVHEDIQVTNPDPKESVSRHKRKYNECFESQSELRNSEGVSDNKEKYVCLVEKCLPEVDYNDFQTVKESVSDSSNRLKRRKVEDETECENHNDPAMYRIDDSSKHDVNICNKDCFFDNEENAVKNTLLRSVNEHGSKGIENVKGNVNDSDTFNENNYRCYPGDIRENITVNDSDNSNENSYGSSPDDFSGQKRKSDVIDAGPLLKYIVNSNHESNTSQTVFEKGKTDSTESQEQLSFRDQAESQQSLYDIEDYVVSNENSLKLESQFTFRSQREYYDALEKDHEAEELFSDSLSLNI